MVEKGKVLSTEVAHHDIGIDNNGRGKVHLADIQRARILTSMVEICAERGFSEASVAHVVERSGVSRRTFYELFTDREDCFLAAFDTGIARVSRVVLDAYDPRSKWAERLRTALAALLTFLDEEPDLAQLLFVGSLGAGPAAIEHRQRVLAQIITLVDEGRTESKAGKDLPPLTAEGVVGGAVSVLHSRLVDSKPRPLIELTGPLMGMIVLPYLGPAAARREIAKPTPKPATKTVHAHCDPLRELPMRLTYRTILVLLALAEHPGASNRQLGEHAGITDQGQASKLLSRLVRLGLIENTLPGPARGAPNAWKLTASGLAFEHAIREQSATSAA